MAAAQAGARPGDAPAAGAAGVAAPGRTRQARGDSAREALLGAAERVFARAGFVGATTAAIAQAAGLPPATLHDHVGSKEDLSREVLSRTLHDWLVPLDGLQPDADPRQALEAYIRAKMAMSAGRPDASRVYANELLHGAPVLGGLLRGELKRVVRAKAAVVDGWVAAGRMAPVDATQLFFTIWAATQTHADFDVQVRAVLGRSRLSARDHQRAADHVVDVLLRGCGLVA